MCPSSDVSTKCAFEMSVCLCPCSSLVRRRVVIVVRWCVSAQCHHHPRAAPPSTGGIPDWYATVRQQHLDRVHKIPCSSLLHRVTFVTCKRVDALMGIPHFMSFNIFSLLSKREKNINAASVASGWEEQHLYLCPSSPCSV